MHGHRAVGKAPRRSTRRLEPTVNQARWAESAEPTLPRTIDVRLARGHVLGRHLEAEETKVADLQRVRLRRLTALCLQFIKEA